MKHSEILKTAESLISNKVHIIEAKEVSLINLPSPSLDIVPGKEIPAGKYGYVDLRFLFPLTNQTPPEAA